MITHGRNELAQLASSLAVSTKTLEEGKSVTVATLCDQDVRRLGDLYNAVLLSDIENAVLDLLAEQGTPLRSYLTQAPRDEITRSDTTELAAAAVLVQVEQWDVDSMHMPNVPKMSRAKSDSGIDILEVRLLRGVAPEDELTPDEVLRVASVKHTVQNTTAGCISSLKASLSENELSRPYLASQLRVLHGNLKAEGYTGEEAGRLFLFLRHLFTDEYVEVVGVAVVDSDSVPDAGPRVDSAVADVTYWRKAFIVGIPQIAQLHQVCV